MISGYELLNNPFLNRGTAFTTEERKQHGLLSYHHGLRRLTNKPMKFTPSTKRRAP